MMSTVRKEHRTHVSTSGPLSVEIVTDRWTVALGLKEVPRDAGGDVLAQMQASVLDALREVPRDAGGEVVRAVGEALGAVDFGVVGDARWTAWGDFGDVPWGLVLTRTASGAVTPAVGSVGERWREVG